MTKVEHKVNLDMVREVAKNLYKHPMSALKELLTNGLDEQSHLPYKDQRMDIFTHVGPDDDIVVEDPANGILDMDKFLESGGGSKKGQMDKAGYKGMGKLGSSILSGTSPYPVVIWHSHRPKMIKPDGIILHAQGAIVTLSDWIEYDVEWMNTIEALSHPGCKVVIKNAKYNKLPPVAKFIAYLSNTYAIRIGRGTQIFLDGNRIAKPEGFDSRKYPLFNLDNGDVIEGNSKANDKTEGDNVSIFIKDILVETYRIDNPCEIWINDNYLTPVTSREAVVDDERYEEVKQKLQKYADEMYPKPEGPHVGKMGKQKEKHALFIAGLQHRDKLLSGEYDENGILGNITGGTGQRKWVKKKATLTKTDGTDPVGVSNGPGKKRGGAYIHNGSKGPHQGYQLGGDHDVATPSGEDMQEKEGPIKPNIRDFPYAFGESKPMCWTDGMTIFWNISWKASQKAWNATGPDWVYVTAPVYAQALVNFEKEEYEEIDADTWQQRYTDILQFLIRSAGK